ncbi:aldo/keto reductase [Tannockella kyphosi]|uniref:aldo/keto reductase n=1 Tax=Tannockella kyphosi TaxID=2899121 RepID=UPI00201129D7|nr:aldo/keto reductase [Tannockella kyphosi]
MDLVRLGKTGIIVNKNGFGALPIQRISTQDAVDLIQMAFHQGINFFDSARAYSDSEEKVGLALHAVREKVYIATKTAAVTVEGFWQDLETSLKLLQTDYIDIYQFHNPSFCPKPGDGSGLYEAMLEAKEKGMIHHIGITNHRHHVAYEAIESGLYETLQFPFNYLASQKELELVELCKEKEIGFICMKAMSGGLITSSYVSYAHLSLYEHVLPIWGVQKESELAEFISYQTCKPIYDHQVEETIKHDRDELAGEFCRGCGYCMPCPAGIEINNAARMSLLLRRSPSAGWLDENGQAMMAKIKDCLHCGKCISKCPYGLDTPELLKRNLADYETFLEKE